MAEKIIFNGKSYGSIAEMPPDARALYEKMSKVFADADQDGVPDVFQQGGFEGLRSSFGTLKELYQMAQAGEIENQNQLAIIQIGESSIMVNGKTYRSPEEMPRQVRLVYEQAVQTAEPGEYQIYDEPWRKRERDSYFRPHDDEKIEPAYASQPTGSVMEPVGTNFWLLAAIAAAVLLCAGAGVLLWLMEAGAF